MQLLILEREVGVPNTRSVGSRAVISQCNAVDLTPEAKPCARRACQTTRKKTGCCCRCHSGGAHSWRWRGARSPPLRLSKGRSPHSLGAAAQRRPLPPHDGLRRPTGGPGLRAAGRSPAGRLSVSAGEGPRPTAAPAGRSCVTCCVSTCLTARSPRPRATPAQVDIVSSWRSGLAAQHHEVQTEAVKTSNRECQVWVRPRAPPLACPS
jgi:hypothetical protein